MNMNAVGSGAREYLLFESGHVLKETLLRGDREGLQASPVGGLGGGRLLTRSRTRGAGQERSKTSCCPSGTLLLLVLLNTQQGGSCGL